MKRRPLIVGLFAAAACSAAAAAHTGGPPTGAEAMLVEGREQEPPARAAAVAAPHAHPLPRPAPAPRTSSNRPARRSKPRPRRAEGRSRRPTRSTAARTASRRTPRTVAGSVRRARELGRITPTDARVYVARHRRATATLGRLAGARAAELGAVVRSAERLARAGRLSAGRMPAVFLELARNERWWSRNGAPVPGARFTFGRDPVVLQYYAGQGLRVQPLATAAEANKLYNACRGHNTRPGTPCRKRTLGRILDRLTELAARRGSFSAWEYHFPFAGGAAPWVSAMAQGTVIQALARGARYLGREKYLAAARAGLGAFETPPPAGVLVPAPGGSRYAMYSQRPELRVLNGFLQAISGIQTYARVSGERRAWRLFRTGNAAAKLAAPGYDTGDWSLYSRPGGESTEDYHRLLRDFLGNLCRREGAPVYCRMKRRFTHYLADPPRLHARPIRGARAGRPVRVRFRLSRRALVTVTTRSAGGRTVFRRSLRLGRGTHEVPWTPRGSGRRYRVHVTATGRRGKRAHVSRLARVR